MEETEDMILEAGETYKDAITKWTPIVKKCLEEDSNCRNSDNYLFIYLSRKLLYKNQVGLEDIQKLPVSFKAVYNIRSTLQGNGILLPTEPCVAVRRRINYEAYKRAHGKGEVDDIVMGKVTNTYFGVE